MTRNHVQCTMIMYNTLCKADHIRHSYCFYIVKKMDLLEVQNLYLKVTIMFRSVSLQVEAYKNAFF